MLHKNQMLSSKNMQLISLDGIDSIRFSESMVLQKFQFFRCRPDLSINIRHRSCNLW